MIRTRLIGVVALAVLVAGCGSSGPSPKEFASRADALCTQATRSAPRTPPSTAKQAVAYTQKQITDRTALDAKLQKLSVPDGEKGDFAAFNADTAKMIEIRRKQNAAAKHNDESGYAKLELGFTRTAEDREKSAIKLGFKVCGRNVTPK